MDVCPLISTKLAPPRLAAVRVAREALLERLGDHRERFVTLILGPAGSGKTTLAAMWRQRLIANGNDVAWYNVGADDDETQWAAYLVASLQQAGVDIGMALAQTLLRVAAESEQHFSAQVTNLLFAHVRPIYLFLEDLHFLRNRTAYGVIERLLENPPQNFHIVLTARGMPTLNLAALQRKGQMLEINFAQLRFTADEQAAFLAELGVRGLSGGQASRLYALTEGWAVGAQLVAWSLKKGGDFEAAFARMTRMAVPLEDEGSTGYLEDTLDSIIEPRQLDILLRLSSCRRLNSDLASTLCNDAAAGALLQTFGAQNLFLLPIESDDPQPWYRFHRIFASFLRRRLKDLPAAELVDINRRASRWFEEHGLYVEAIRHARYAGDTARLIDLMTAAARPLVYAGQFIQLLRWLDDVPAEALQERMRLLLCLGWAQLSSRRPGAFEATLAAIEKHPEIAAPEVDFEVRLLRGFHMLARDDTERLLPLLEPFIDHPPRTDRFNLLMLSIIGSVALVGAGQYERARDVVGECQTRLRQLHGARSRPFLEWVPGFSLLVQGDYIQARESLERLLRDLEAESALAESSAAYVAAYLAEVCWQLGDLEAAEDHLDTYGEAVDLIGTPECILYALRIKARLHFQRGDLARALQALDELERLAQDEDWDRLAAWSLAERVRMLGTRVTSLTAMREALRRLNRLSARYPEDVPDSRCEIRLAAAIAAVDAASAEFDWQRVIQLSQPLADECTRRGRMYLAARMRVLMAIAILRSGDVTAALGLARPMVNFADQHGMRRLFADEGEAGADLVREMFKLADLARGERHFLDSQLLRSGHDPVATNSAGQAQAGGSGSGDGGGSELLSPREREIVQLLSRALSRKTIARTLNVSPGTIKWHLRNIYDKLGAVSREDAVAKARELNVLERGGK